MDYPAHNRQSASYREARRKLLEAEIALKDQRERVAALRRELPEGAPVGEDYAFREGPADLAADGPASTTRLSELFGDGQDSLIVIHAMYGEADELMCPMCTMWADGYNAVAPHVKQRANIVLVARKELGALRAYARGRGWDQLRHLSSEGSSFNTDYGMEMPDGSQLPGISVFTRDEDGTIRSQYTQCAMMGEGHFRGLDALSPVWNLFDLTPEGRGDWMPKRQY